MFGENSVKIMTAASTMATIATAGGAIPTAVVPVASAAGELVAPSQAWGVHIFHTVIPF